MPAPRIGCTHAPIDWVAEQRRRDRQREWLGRFTSEVLYHDDEQVVVTPTGLSMLSHWAKGVLPTDAYDGMVWMVDGDLVEAVEMEPCGSAEHVFWIFHRRVRMVGSR